MTKQQKTSRGTSSQVSKSDLPPFFVKRIREGSFILILTVALYMLLSLSTYHQADPGWSHSGPFAQRVANAGGRVGAYLADSLYFAFGYFSYVLPFCLVYGSWMILKDHRALRHLNQTMLSIRIAGFLFLVASSCGLLALKGDIQGVLATHSGGIIGQSVAHSLNRALNEEGTMMLLIAMLLVGITWLTGLSWLQMTEIVGRLTVQLTHLIVRLVTRSVNIMRQLKFSFPEKTIATPREIKREPIASPTLAREKAKKEKPVVKAAVPIEVPVVAKKKEPALPKVAVSGSLPSLSLLDKGIPGKPLGGYTHQELEQLSREVEQHLLDFGVQVDVVAVHPGPVITRFELQLAAGVKASKLTALSKDLARSLSVSSVRVVEIIPGKTVVGIELPNQDRASVSLSEVLSADVYQQAHSPLTLALGVDIAGHPMVVDLAKMPHLLVAGTTGSGKSVGINAMILSLLYRATPDQVRLIMVDPKMLELSIYDGIPHLLTPVVTDMKEAAAALRWCVGEMERRYRLMAALGVRNLMGYNAKVAEAASGNEPLVDPLWKPGSSMEEEAPLLESLPYVVVIIDELADMMMVVGKKVEQLIARIAQKARAAGIHLILATQRPSVDVLTGLIKSNIPTRISFQVSSKIDSRTILDQQGAEQLLGHGDMLFLAPGTGAPLRVHGAFVNDQEVHRIADDWRSRGTPQYIDEITQSVGDGSEGGFGEESESTEEADPLYDQAVEFVIQTRKASISSVQRRFKIGYNRAARLVEEMERTGLVGPLDGGFRDVLAPSGAED